MKKYVSILLFFLSNTIHSTGCNHSATNTQDTCGQGVDFISSVENSFEASGMQITTVPKGNKTQAREDMAFITKALGEQNIDLKNLQIINLLSKNKFTLQPASSADSMLIFLYKVSVVNPDEAVKNFIKKISENNFFIASLRSEAPVTIYYYYHAGEANTIYIFSHYGLAGYYPKFNIQQCIQCILKNRST